MIDSTECVIFLDTPNSLKMDENSLSQTESPWIYSELLTTKMIRQLVPKRKSAQPFRFDDSSVHSNLKVTYDLDLSHLYNLSINNFLTAIEAGKSGTAILDTIYSEIANR